MQRTMYMVCCQALNSLDGTLKGRAFDGEGDQALGTLNPRIKPLTPQVSCMLCVTAASGSIVRSDG